MAKDYIYVIAKTYIRNKPRKEWGKKGGASEDATRR